MKTNSVSAAMKSANHAESGRTPVIHKVASKPKPSKENAAAHPEHDAQRHHQIEEAAYFLAEKRGFAAEGALDDWLSAEAQFVDGKTAFPSP
ncbi:MAG TPA: DUF2934 domain-containing protein [Rhodocyclaceae bacterium]|nr:DUF2934 domain-containing protein [Rhodocyclaceae bacterium]